MKRTYHMDAYKVVKLFEASDKQFYINGKYAFEPGVWRPIQYIKEYNRMVEIKVDGVTSYLYPETTLEIRIGE